jgi:hypothetical protein
MDAAPQADIEDVTEPGKWYINTTTGKFFSYEDIDNTWTLTYKPVVDGDLGDGFTFNVIPDPETVSSFAFKSCKIKYVNGTDNTEGYYVYLPPRGPLQNARRLADKPQDDTHTPAHTANYDGVPSAGNYLMWQDDGAAAPTTAGWAEHYRYNLPEMITDNWSASARIPAGLVYLWDPVGSGTILEGLVLTAENAVSPSSWLFVASGSALDSYLATTQGLSCYPVASLQSSSHAAAYYPAGGLRVVTVGTDLATSLNLLWKRFYDHDHSSQNSMPTKLVDHNSLIGLVVKSNDVMWTPSAWDYDDHTQYLHRSGLGARDLYQNGMMGDLFLMSTGAASDYNNITSSSHYLRFGHSTNGPNIRFVAGSGLVLDNANSFSLQTNGALYFHGDRTDYIWVDLGYLGDEVLGDWFYNTDGSHNHFAQSGDAAFLYVNTCDWPEDMELISVEIDWQTAGAGTALAATFWQDSWGTTPVQLSGDPTNTLTCGATGSRRRDEFLVDGQYTWTHESNRLAMEIESKQAADRIYGIRLQVRYSNTCKWGS